VDTKYNFSFGNVIAHFVPGFLLSLSFSQSKIFSVFYNIPKNNLLENVIIFIIPLALGLFIDNCRYLLLKLPCLFSKTFRKWCDCKTAPSDVAGIKLYNWIIDNHFRYHQFSGNLAIAILFSAILLRGKFTIWPLFIASLVLSISAILIYKTTVESIKKAFK